MNKNYNHSGIKLMQYFFSRLQVSNMLSHDKYYNPTVDLSWFYTKNLPRDIIQDTVARLLARNKEYTENAKYFEKEPTDISHVTIKNIDGLFSVEFTGADDWTRLQIIESTYDINRPRVPTISFLRFQDEIIKTIISRENGKENPDYTSFRAGIGPSLDDGCKNLVNYYKYLMDEIERKSKIPDSNSGIEYMKYFFSKLQPEKMFSRDRFDNPIVPLSWFHTEDLPISIVQKTIARLMAENNKTYEESSQIRGKRPTDISSVGIHVFDEEFSVRFTGADDWTLLQVVEDPSAKSDRTIPTISFDQFQNEIIKTILDKNMEIRRSDFGALRNGIGPCLNDACKNLVTYYRAMQIEKQKISRLEKQDQNIEFSDEEKQPTEEKDGVIYFSGIVSLPDSSGESRTRTFKDEPTQKQDRINDIIPIEERLAILKSNNPIAQGTISRRKENGSIDPKAYHTFIYSTLLKEIPNNKAQGLLFVCEPERGDMETRLFYVPQKEVDDLLTNNPGLSEKSLLMSYTQEHLEKLRSSFRKDGGIIVRHRGIELYKNMLSLYLNGEISQHMRNHVTRYSINLRHLYNDAELKIPRLKQLNKNDFGKLGIENNLAGKVDRQAQDEISVTEQTQDIPIEL